MCSLSGPPRRAAREADGLLFHKVQEGALMRQVLDNFSVLVIKDEGEDMNGIYIIPNGQPHRATKVAGPQVMHRMDDLLAEAYRNF